MEAIKVNLIPNGIPEACHASQYDEGRQIRLDIFDGLTPYTIQAGDTFTLNVRKPDNHVITETVTGTEGNTYLVIDTTEQMTAVTGENLCEIRLENDGDNIGSLNFIMQVEKDVIANGIPSESVIEDLEALVVEAVGENYYTKTETDELLDTKADVTDLLDLLPTDTASGAIANFTDGADNVPVKALSVEFAATQAEGTPTPSAPIPIVGVDKVNVTDCGINVCDEVFEVGDIDATTGQNAGGTSTIRTKNYIPIKPDTQYYAYISGRGTATLRTRFYDINKNYIGSTQKNGSPVEYNARFTTPENAYYLRFTPQTAYGTTYNNDISINYPNTETEYHAYTGGTTALINLGGTYYGGSVDAVTGKITKQIDTYTITGAETSVQILQGTNNNGYRIGILIANSTNKYSGLRSSIAENANILNAATWEVGKFCTYSGRLYITVPNDYDTVAKALTYLTGGVFEYELATPLVVYASNTAEIPTILGVNNFFSDAGDVDVTIRADIALYIQKMLGGNANRSLGANPSILRTGAISTDIEVREPVEPDSEPVELEREVTEQPENEGDDNEER